MFLTSDIYLSVLLLTYKDGLAKWHFEFKASLFPMENTSENSFFSPAAGKPLNKTTSWFLPCYTLNYTQTNCIITLNPHDPCHRQHFSNELYLEVVRKPLFYPKQLGGKWIISYKLKEFLL
jgi:hypothetical protein